MWGDDILDEIQTPSPVDNPQEQRYLNYLAETAEVMRQIADSEAGVQQLVGGLKAHVISIPPGHVLTNPEMPYLPPEWRRMNDNNSVWFDMANEAGLRNPMLVWAEVPFFEFQQMSFEMRTDAVRGYREWLWQQHDIRSYGMVATGNGIVFLASHDPRAPDRDIEAEYGMRFSEYLTELGKPNKRDKVFLNSKGRYFVRGGRPAVPDPDRPGHLTGGEMAIGNPDTGNGGLVTWETYDVTATTEEFSWLNEDKHVSDGEMYTSRRTADRMWRAATGKDLPNWADRIQLDMMVPGGEPNENVMIKGFMNIQPDAIWDTAGHRVDVRVSKEGMARQRGNNDYTMGRLKLYSAYHENLQTPDLEAVDGLLAYPEIVKHIQEEEAMLWYEEESVRQALEAPDRGLESISERLSDELLDPTDGGKLQPGDREYNRRWDDIIDRLGIREDAALALAVNQSPYASAQVMRQFADLGQRMVHRDQRVRGALAPWMSKFKAKRTSHEAFGVPEPTLGYATLGMRDLGEGMWSTAFILNREDAANPHVLARDGGPDNDDHYEIIVKQDKDGNYYGYAGRSPRDVDGGNVWHLTAENAEQAVDVFNLHVYAAVHDDPVTGGFIVPVSPDITSGGMQDLYDQSVIKPEAFNPEDVQSAIDDITDYGDWERRKVGQAKRIALLAGNSSIGSVTNLVSLANRSGLITRENVADWIIALSDLIDAEVQGTGTGINMPRAVAAKLIYAMEEGRMVSASLMENRFGIRRALVEAYVDIYGATRHRGDSGVATATAQQFINDHVSESAGLDRSTNPRVRTITEITDSISKFHVLTADMDSVDWLTTARQSSPNDYGRWITPEVKELARQMTMEFSTVTGEIKNTILPAAMDRYGITWSPQHTERRRVLRNRLFSAAFEEFDQKAVVYEATALQTDNYTPGMLMAAVKQNQIMGVKAFELNDDADNARFQRLIHERVTVGFSRSEKASYYASGDGSPHLAITIAGNPYDTAKGRRWMPTDWRGSTITYHDDIKRLGGFMDVVGANDQHALRWSQMLGYDLVFVDMVRGQSPRLDSQFQKNILSLGGQRQLRDFQVGVFKLVPNSVIRNMPHAERIEWQKDRVLKSYREQRWLPPPWLGDDDSMGDAYYRRPEHRPDVGVGPTRRDMTAVLSHDLGSGNRMYIDQSNGTFLGMVPRGEQVRTATLPMVIRGAPSTVMQRIAEIDDRARAQGIQPVPKAVDYVRQRQSIRPKREAVSGAEATLENMVAEARDAQRTMAGDHRVSLEKRMYLSGEVEHFITLEDAGRAARDFEAWRQGKLGQVQGVSKALQAARTREEASAAVLKDLAYRAEMRFAQDVSHGVWFPVTDERNGRTRYIHSEGRTDQLRKHVNLTASIKIPTGFGSIDLVARHYGYASQQMRKKLMAWATDWQDPQMFDGDVDRMRSATPPEIYQEQLRVAQGNVSLMTKMYIAELITKDSQPGNLFDIGIIGTADDAFDYAVDFKNTMRQLSTLMSDASSQDILAYVRLTMRDGYEALMKSMGMPILRYDEVLQRPEGIEIQALHDQLAQSYLGDDIRLVQRTFDEIDTHFARRDWRGAWLTAKKLGGTHTVNFVKRHVHTFAADIPGVDAELHGLGRTMMAVTSGPGRGVMQLNPIMTDATANRAAGRMSFAINNLVMSTLEKVNKDAARTVWNARRNTPFLPRMLRTPADVRFAVWNQVRFEDSRYNWNERKRPGIRTGVIARIKWWHLLLGAGGKMKAIRWVQGNGTSLEKRWLLRRQSDTDALCIDNANMGWIPSEIPFGTGHPAPPAHPGCNCELQVRQSRSGSPSLMRDWQRVSKPRFHDVGQFIRGEGGELLPTGNVISDSIKPLGYDILSDNASIAGGLGLSPSNLILPEI